MKLNCKQCNEEIKGFEQTRFEAFNGGVLLTVHYECLEDALKEFDNEHLVEMYKGVKIYKYNGEYYDNVKSKYYFNSLNDVKECIDNNGISEKWVIHKNDISMVAINQYLGNDVF